MYDKSLASILDYHHSMVTDTARVEAFRQAILATVRPGDVVLDLGCGTGLLSFFACQAGATRVVAVDSGEVIELARQLSRRHGFDDRMECFRSRSQDLRLDVRADVLITETLGNGGFDEGILGTVLDARKRLLKADARLLPRAVGLTLCATGATHLTERRSAWPGDLHGIDFSSMRPLAANHLAWDHLDPALFLSSAVDLQAVDLAALEVAEYSARAALEVRAEGSVHALGGWFHSRLTDDPTSIRLDNAPATGAPSWRQMLLPVAPSLAVQPGDTLHVDLRVQDNGSLWSWHVQRQRSAPSPDGSASQRLEGSRQHSSFFGTFLSPTALRQQEASFRPSLNDDGAVELWVLQHMDGSRSLSDLAAAAAEHFPRRFPTADDALAAVRGICRRFAAGAEITPSA